MVKKILLIATLGVIVMTGCSPAARQAAGRAVAGGLAGAAATNTQPKLMLFGGEGHKTYLGCLNCSQYASDSVLNKYGEHGSPYYTDSIWNRYSEFGSAYSNYSSCNQYATDPPVIVDQNGNYYGRLTLNVYHLEIGAGKRYLDWLSGLCGN